MRIWDIHPGYLNRQSLLGEHRELHGIVSILTNGKKGYSRHPETLRWVGYGWALKQRHALLVAEMALRGYSHQSPVVVHRNGDQWPKVFVDEPWLQMQLVATKYKNKEPGRIRLPKNAQQLWSQHKYSIMARDISLYQSIGKEVSGESSRGAFQELINTLTIQMRRRPSVGGIRNALQHMWGHISERSKYRAEIDKWSLQRLLNEIQHQALTSGEPYLCSSTALSELKVWIPGR